MTNTTTATNRYAGTCECGTYVPACEGFYDGNVLCSPRRHGAELYEYDGEEIVIDTMACENYRRLEAKRAILWRRERAAAEAERALDPEVIAEREARAERNREMEAQDAAWAAQGLKRCKRCGGHGALEQWRHTGSVCFECDGSGVVAR